MSSVVGDLLYIMSGFGKLVCMNTDDGTIRWSRDMEEELDGKINRYGYNETVVINGDIVYCTPGGEKSFMVAHFLFRNF